MNKPIREAFNDVRKFCGDLKNAMVAATEDTGWKTVTSGIQEVTYRKKNGWVYAHVRHSESNVPAKTITTIYTLPKGYRPSQTVYVPVDNSGGTVGVQARIEADGQVRVYASAATQYFNVVGVFPIGGGCITAFSNFLRGGTCYA